MLWEHFMVFIHDIWTSILDDAVKWIFALIIPAVPTAAYALWRKLRYRDFRTGTFKDDVKFFDGIRKAAARRVKGAENIKIGKLVVLHYIRDDFQIGFRAYENLSLISSDTEGYLPLYIATDRWGPASIVDYFEWDDDAHPPEIGSTTVPPKTTPALTIRGNRPRNLSIFHFYRDPVGRGGDWFWVNPFSVGSHVRLSHYVVVRNDDLARWNPNKFVFQVEPNSSIGFSPAVYVMLSPEPNNAKLKDARKLVSKFLAIPEPDLKKSLPTDFAKVKQHVSEIFSGGSFSPDVTVFWLNRPAKETNLFLAYTFPTSS
jgi:hypothetical protein